MKNRSSALTFKTLLTIVVLGTTFITSAQSKLDIKSDKWYTLEENSSSKVEYRKVACTNDPNGMNREEVQIQLTNKSDRELTFSWSTSLVYDHRVLNENGENKELSYSVSVAPNSTSTPKCFGRNQAQQIMIQLIDVESSVLKDFHLNNLKVE